MDLEMGCLIVGLTIFYALALFAIALYIAKIFPHSWFDEKLNALIGLIPSPIKACLGLFIGLLSIGGSLVVFMSSEEPLGFAKFMSLITGVIGGGCLVWWVIAEIVAYYSLRE